jgi:hypothetical protein
MVYDGESGSGGSSSDRGGAGPEEDGEEEDASDQQEEQDGGGAPSDPVEGVPLLLVSSKGHLVREKTDEENVASEQEDELAEAGAQSIPAEDSPPEFSSDGGLEPIPVDDDRLMVRCMLQPQNLLPKRCTTLLLLKHQRFTSLLHLFTSNGTHFSPS